MSGSGNYQSGNNNSGWGNNYSNNVDNCEISVWDPSSINKSKTTSYNTAATNSPISNFSVASSHSSPWHESVPTDPTPLRLNNAYNVPNTPPLQHSGQQNQYSDIYYTPSGDGANYQTTNPNHKMDQKYYDQTQQINQDSSYGQLQNSSYYQYQPSQNPSYSSSMNYGQPHQQDNYDRSSVSNQSANSDSFYNARIANREYQPSNPTANPSYVPASNDSITHWSDFSNPLSEKEPTTATIVERIKQTPEEKLIAADVLRKPTSISKAALARLGNDLQNASSHLQSVEALEKFKHLQLGIHPEPTTPDAFQPRSNLSVTAAEFVPRSASPQSKDVRISDWVKQVESSDIRCLTSSPIPLQYSMQSSYSRYFQENSNSVIQEDYSKTALLESDLYSNPLSELESVKSNLNLTTTEELVTPDCKDELESIKKFKQEDEIVNNVSMNKQEPSGKLSLSKYPCTSEKYKIQLLGFASLQQLGYSLEEDLLIKNKITPIVPTQTDDETKNYVLDLVTQQINNLIYDPASFDSVIAPFVLELRSCNLSQDVVSLVVDQIYEACVLEANFRYLGSQVCDSLSRKKSGLPKFRSILLTKAQKEFKVMPEALAGDKEAMERARGFTLFVAELYLSLFNEEKDGTLTRFFVLGRAMLDVVKNLIERPLDENVQCAVRVIKLTALCLEDTLKGDGKGSMEKFETILNNIEKFVEETSTTDLKKSTKSLINGLVRLRGNNWGRTTVKETFPTEPPIQPYLPGSSPHQIMDENYFMNEPVFFTPDGVQYTSADAAIPEFYDRHLSKYQQPYETLPAEQEYNNDENSDPFAEFKENPEDQSYADWSENAGETSGLPEDYDDDFDEFLKNLDEDQK